MQDLYIFVIDTDYYAGNFERNLCAYATGYVGECGVGRQMAQQFYEDMGLLRPVERSTRTSVAPAAAKARAAAWPRLPDAPVISTTCPIRSIIDQPPVAKPG